MDGSGGVALLLVIDVASSEMEWGSKNQNTLLCLEGLHLFNNNYSHFAKYPICMSSFSSVKYGYLVMR